MSSSFVERSRVWVRPRRILFTALVLATIAALGLAVWRLLQLNGLSPLETAILALFVVLSAPIAVSFWTALMGFFLRMAGGDSLEITRELETGPNEDELPLTAIVLPVYNEDPARVMAGLKATYESLERTGLLRFFEFFILSDTTDPDVWVREELAFVDARHEVSDPGRIFYRNRRQNIERKTGNIAEFCRSWGGRYKYMIVFDADSIMTGSSLVNMVRLMERNPWAGIIQAPPRPVNRQSLFGRVHQFAMHMYSSLFISGLNFWQGGAGNYWGHNAIIRIEPFIEHCHLPTLPGKPPLGGAILSHDFVEAAFMRRAGWRVHLASELGGSYEEMPATLVGYAARDRRWCQGNLQHGKLLFSPGLHFISRVHIWMGMMGYLASPLWLLMLVLTTVEGIRQAVTPHPYFSGSPTLYPNWPVSMEKPALTLFAVIMGFLLLPKFLSILAQWRHAGGLTRFGGKLRALGSVALEILLSTLLAPNLALLQSRFVVGILLGSNGKWEAQDRGDRGTTWREGIHRHWPATAIGIVWTVLLALTAPKLLVWFSPVLLGFWLAIPLSVWTSRAEAGLAARRAGLFLIPEEAQPPRILVDFHSALRDFESRSWCEPGDPLSRVLREPEVKEMHLALLPEYTAEEDAMKVHHRQGLVLKYRERGADSLTSQEKRELLLHSDSIEALTPQERLRVTHA